MWTAYLFVLHVFAALGLAVFLTWAGVWLHRIFLEDETPYI